MSERDHTVVGGSHGVEADLDDMDAAGGLIRSKGWNVGETALATHKYVLDANLLSSAVLAPATFATFECGLLGALDGPGGLSANAVRMTATGSFLQAKATAPRHDRPGTGVPRRRPPAHPGPGLRARAHHRTAADRGGDGAGAVAGRLLRRPEPVAAGAPRRAGGGDREHARPARLLHARGRLPRLTEQGAALLALLYDQDLGGLTSRAGRGGRPGQPRRTRCASSTRWPTSPTRSRSSASARRRTRSTTSTCLAPRPSTARSRRAPRPAGRAHRQRARAEPRHQLRRGRRGRQRLRRGRPPGDARGRHPARCAREPARPARAASSRPGSPRPSRTARAAGPTGSTTSSRRARRSTTSSCPTTSRCSPWSTSTTSCRASTGGVRRRRPAHHHRHRGADGLGRGQPLHDRALPADGRRPRGVRRPGRPRRAGPASGLHPGGGSTAWTFHMARG